MFKIKRIGFSFIKLTALFDVNRMWFRLLLVLLFNKMDYSNLTSEYDRINKYMMYSFNTVLLLFYFVRLVPSKTY